jgi:hypothetical protein
MTPIPEVAQSSERIFAGKESSRISPNLVWYGSSSDMRLTRADRPVLAAPLVTGNAGARLARLDGAVAGSEVSEVRKQAEPGFGISDRAGYGLGPVRIGFCGRFGDLG